MFRWRLVRDLKRRCPFIVELKNVPFKNQEQVLFYIVDRLPRFCGGKMDASGNGAYLAEQARYRYGSGMVEEVKMTPGLVPGEYAAVQGRL